MVAAAARGTNHPDGKYEKRKWINRRDLGHFHPFQDAILQTFVSPGTFIIADFHRCLYFYEVETNVCSPHRRKKKNHLGCLWKRCVGWLMRRNVT
ncbi:hypothetical protein CEXT_267331 [Caerostris extrusa]|uniref:Uncharacterized protein n=1 Tax=Caerostris extrusa TaxID=172846 RepID=A0AAV4R1C0_CAEEX|nr:hypothetical protein CEXT_267331 [Caerostris extrusa]